MRVLEAVCTGVDMNGFETVSRWWRVVTVAFVWLLSDSLDCERSVNLPLEHLTKVLSVSEGVSEDGVMRNSCP